jgi:hypothetical protein
LAACVGVFRAAVFASGFGVKPLRGIPHKKWLETLYGEEHKK